MAAIPWTIGMEMVATGDVLKSFLTCTLLFDNS